MVLNFTAEITSHKILSLPPVQVITLKAARSVQVWCNAPVGQNVLRTELVRLASRSLLHTPTMGTNQRWNVNTEKYIPLSRMLQNYRSRNATMLERLFPFVTFSIRIIYITCMWKDLLPIFVFLCIWRWCRMFPVLWDALHLATLDVSIAPVSFQL